MADRLPPLDENTARRRCDDAHFVRALAIAQSRIEPKATDVWWNGGHARPVLEVKAAVAGVTDTDFPSPLVSPAADFLLRMRDRAILEQLVGLRRAPMRTPVVMEGLVATATRVAGGSAIPALVGSFDTAILEPFKHAGIYVASNESLRSTIALQSLLDVLAGAVSEAENASLLDPGNVDSLLYAADNFVASGSSAAQVLTDLRDLCAAAPRGNTLVMCRGSATFYGTLEATNGTLLFPNVGPNGGSMLNMPVLITAPRSAIREHRGIGTTPRCIGAKARGREIAPGVSPEGWRQMIPPVGVVFCNLDSADVVDDALTLFLLLSDGSLVGVCLPIDDLIRQGHTVIEAGDAPAFCVDPVLQ